MGDEEQSRIASLETEVRLLRDDFNKFESNFLKSFEEHKKDDDGNFKDLSVAIHNNDTRLVKLETRIAIYIVLGSAIAGPIITIALKHFMS